MTGRVAAAVVALGLLAGCNGSGGDDGDDGDDLQVGSTQEFCESFDEARSLSFSGTDGGSELRDRLAGLTYDDATDGDARAFIDALDRSAEAPEDEGAAILIDALDSFLAIQDHYDKEC